MFSLQLMHEEINYKACGLFSIDNGLIFTVSISSVQVFISMDYLSTVLSTVYLSLTS